MKSFISTPGRFINNSEVLCFVDKLPQNTREILEFFRKEGFNTSYHDRYFSFSLPLENQKATDTVFKKTDSSSN